MKALVTKEIRLLQPAFAGTLLLAVLPVWLFTEDYLRYTSCTATVYPLIFGMVILALSTFGLEFGHGTLPLLLVQPMPRRRIWRTKIIPLAAAVLTTYAAWLGSCVIRARGQFLGPETILVGGAMVLAVVAGGLWTTLLLRQVTSAFWFTILLPGAIATICAASEASATVTGIALLCYSVASYVFARQYFLRLEETAWTGGEVALPTWLAETLGGQAADRLPRPLAALFMKELRLHQVVVVGMAGLFVLHLAVVFLRNSPLLSSSSPLRMPLEVFGGIWLIVPLLVGGLSVAEERKLGTHQGNLCLPSSRPVQFVIKLLVALLIGGLLTPVLFWVVEGLGGVTGMVSRPQNFRSSDFLGICTGFLGVTLVGFYASTLSRSVVQAMAVAVAVAGACISFVALMAATTEYLDVWRWHGGALLLYFATPILPTILIWLAYRNFRSVSEGWHLWRWNLQVLVFLIAAVLLVSGALYNRAWELLAQQEPEHGQPQLSGPAPAFLEGYHWQAVTARLPDGRLWVNRIRYYPGKVFLRIGGGTGVRVGGHWVNLNQRQVIHGTDWLDAYANSRDLVAICSDGTLWVMERPNRPHDEVPKESSSNEPAGLVQFGDDSGWRSVVAEFQRSVVLLKRDGTLWSWGTNSFSDRQVWPGLRAFTPHRMGNDSDWAHILRGPGQIFAWKQDGTAWSLRRAAYKAKSRETEIAPARVLVRFSQLDGRPFRSISFYPRWGDHVGVREDGTLWAWSIREENPSAYAATPIQIGKDTDWTQVQNDGSRLVGLKADGSLWEWNPGVRYVEEFSFTEHAPTQLSRHTDWLAIGPGTGGVLCLAADGKLWLYWDRNEPFGSAEYGQPMLRPPRRPTLLGNVLER